MMVTKQMDIWYYPDHYTFVGMIDPSKDDDGHSKQTMPTR